MGNLLKLSRSAQAVFVGRRQGRYQKGSQYLSIFEAGSKRREKPVHRESRGSSCIRTFRTWSLGFEAEVARPPRCLRHGCRPPTALLLHAGCMGIKRSQVWIFAPCLSYPPTIVVNWPPAGGGQRVKRPDQMLSLACARDLRGLKSIHGTLCLQVWCMH